MTRLVRNPNLLVSWTGRRALVVALDVHRRLLASQEILDVLGAFSTPLSPDMACAALPEFEPKALRTLVRLLSRNSFLVEERTAKRRAVWKRTFGSNLASAYYHAATRDVRYLVRPGQVDVLLRAQVARQRRPSLRKRYANRPRQPLPRDLSIDDAAGLERILLARRTVRSFSREPVRLEDVAALIRGTWGQTGWIHGGPLGWLVGKTSPSAGSLHPIECYVLAWNVSGLTPGIYHYDVKGDELRLLKLGNFRMEAVKAASDQRWVGGAAFLCIMTAVFTRTLWKYGSEGAYGVLWMDAGHLCQTFDLLATARGLGPFQTAAIQDTFIEKLIGLDGVKEFPVYLCGAGVPRRPLLAAP